MRRFFFECIFVLLLILLSLAEDDPGDGGGEVVQGASLEVYEENGADESDDALEFDFILWGDGEDI